MRADRLEPHFQRTLRCRAQVVAANDRDTSRVTLAVRLGLRPSRSLRDSTKPTNA
jgi:hypothetical protein